MKQTKQNEIIRDETNEEKRNKNKQNTKYYEKRDKLKITKKGKKRNRRK